MASLKENQENQKKEIRVDPEQIKQMEDFMKKENIAPKLDDTGRLAWEDYLKMFKVIITFQLRNTLAIHDEMKEERREFVKTGNKQAFSDICYHMLERIDVMKHKVAFTVRDMLDINFEAFSEQ